MSSSLKLETALTSATQGPQAAPACAASAASAAPRPSSRGPTDPPPLALHIMVTLPSQIASTGPLDTSVGPRRWAVTSSSLDERSLLGPCSDTPSVEASRRNSFRLGVSTQLV